MRTVTVANQKGGVGKTTTALHIAAALARRGERVLAIDLDSQAHLTLAARVSPLAASMHEVMRGSATIADVLLPSSHGFSVAPADQMLARVSDSVAITTLREALAAGESRFEWCVIDTPPSLGSLSLNALVAADGGVIAPLVPEVLALKGLQFLLQTVGELRAVAPALHVRAILPTMIRWQWVSHRELVGALPSLVPEVPTIAPIPVHGAVVRAAMRRTTVLQSAPRSAPAVVLRALAASLLADAGVAEAFISPCAGVQRSSHHLRTDMHARFAHPAVLGTRGLNAPAPLANGGGVAAVGAVA